MKATTLMLACILAALCLAEGASSWALVGYRLIGREAHPNAKYADLPVYQRDPNGVAYWAEFDRAAAVHYVDGLGWQRDDFHGQFINVRHRHRLLADGPHDRRHSSLSVFGGSTVWGTGVTDSATIPAYLHAENFGEGAYVSAQNLLQFQAQDDTPLTAIFYEGVNDAYASCINPGIDGATLMYARMKQKVEYRQGSDLRLADLAGLLVHPTSPEHFRCESRSTAEQAAHVMVRTWKQAQDLGDQRGVRTIFLLQPNAYVGHPDTADLALDEAVRPSMRNFYASVGQAVHDLNIREYHDLSRVLDGQRERFIDYAHVTADGNSEIAAAIARVL